MGNFKASSDTLLKAYEIAESVFGENHYETLDYLLSLAGCHILAGNYNLAHTYLQKSLEIGSKSLRANFSFLSSIERELYWQKNIEMYNSSIENSFNIPDNTSA